MITNKPKHTFKIDFNTSVLTKVEKEISIPSYWTYNNCYYWKIVSEKEAVCACHTGYGLSMVEASEPKRPFSHKEIKECSKDEFDRVFASAIEAIHSLNRLQAPE